MATNDFRRRQSWTGLTIVVTTSRAVHRHKLRETPCLTLRMAGINNIVVVQNKVDFSATARERAVELAK